MTITTTPSANQTLVRVWFGSEVIASHTAEPDVAARYARLMGRRFAGLKVTVDPAAADETTKEARPLPPEALWGHRPPG